MSNGPYRSLYGGAVNLVSLTHEYVNVPFNWIIQNGFWILQAALSCQLWQLYLQYVQLTKDTAKHSVGYKEQFKVWNLKKTTINDVVHIQWI